MEKNKVKSEKPEPVVKKRKIDQKFVDRGTPNEGVGNFNTISSGMI